MSGLHILTAPVVMPVDLMSMKNYLRVSTDADDNLIASLIGAACAFCESFTGRALIEQTLRYGMRLDRGVLGPVIVSLPRPPLIRVVSVQTTDYFEQNEDLSVDDYSVDSVSDPGRLLLDVCKRLPENIVIDYIAGYGDQPDDVPEAFVLAIKQMVGFWYDNRGDVSLVPPVSVLALLASYKVLALGGA